MRPFCYFTVGRLVTEIITDELSHLCSGVTRCKGIHLILKAIHMQELLSLTPDGTSIFYYHLLDVQMMAWNEWLSPLFELSVIQRNVCAAFLNKFTWKFLNFVQKVLELYRKNGMCGSEVPCFVWLLVTLINNHLMYFKINFMTPMIQTAVVLKHLERSCPSDYLIFVWYCWALHNWLCASTSSARVFLQLHYIPKKKN